MNPCSPRICDLSECDVLALSVVVTQKFASIIKDADTLSFWGDFFTALGANITMLSNQRARIETCKQADKTDATNAANNNTAATNQNNTKQNSTTQNQTNAKPAAEQKSTQNKPETNSKETKKEDIKKKSDEVKENHG